jgi:predicted RNase H-like nuclease (RuvC/YqgF family)
MKVQQAKSDSLIARQTLDIHALKQEATNFIAEKNKKEEQIKKLNDDASKLTAEITLKQNNIDLIAQQINQQIQVLKNASYTIDPAWIDQLINTCNQFKDKSKITNYAWLSEFKTKSSAITLVMNKIQTARFLKKADLENLKADFDKSYGLENPNFTQLIGDKNRCLEKLENYTDAFCEVFDNINVAIEMKSFQPKQREDFLLAKSYKAALEYPMLQTVIAEVIKSGYTVNPLKGKIDCE